MALGFGALTAFGALVACGNFSGTDTSASSGDGASGETSSVADGNGSLGDGSGAGSGGDSSDDGALDGGTVPCAARADKGFVCVDFDDGKFYVAGAASGIPSGSNRTVRSPGHSMPNAMWSDGFGAYSDSLDASATPTITGFHAELWVYIDAYADSGTIDGQLIRVGIAPHQCYVDLRLQSDTVILQTHCVYTDDASDWYASKKITQGPLVTGQWLQLALDVDYAKAIAIGAIDGVAGPTLSLNPHAAPGGTPFTQIGSITGASVGFDDVFVAVE
jgi:hypothetical protein